MEADVPSVLPTGAAVAKRRVRSLAPISFWATGLGIGMPVALERPT
jgi:hypothetical protein